MKRSNINYRFILFACCFFISACGAEPSIDDDIKQLPQITVGQTMTDIISQHGQPKSIQHQVKQGGAIWGPEEEFWHKIPNGSQMEVWRYEKERAAMSLYFVDGNKSVDYIAVYHSSIIY